MWTFLMGKKTYLLALGVFGYNALGYLIYGTPIDWAAVKTAAFACTLRHGIGAARP